MDQTPALPLGVKDLEDACGLVTTHGSLPFKNNLAERDSLQVERLRTAGAIVVGKTNAPEFGWTAITKNLLFGETRNPWRLDRTPGGSSGGSSAAIAAGVVAMATASDGGGSVCLPATFTGCFGLKPSFGRIPHGPDALWVTIDTAGHGPLTRTVEDAALHLDVTVGEHPLDPSSLPPSRRLVPIGPPPAEAQLSASDSLRISATPSCNPMWRRPWRPPPSCSKSSDTRSKS